MANVKYSDIYRSVNSYNSNRIFSALDNYIYFYHTGALFELPVYPEHVSDSSSANFQQSTPLSRSAPIYSYANSGPRSIQFSFQLHRDLMKQVKTVFTNQGNIGHDEYIDVLIKNIQACSVPKYGGASKLIDPPMVAIKIENSLFIKGVVKGSVGIDWKQPVLRDGKYAAADINFTVEEVTPYSAQDIQRIGSFRNPGDTPIPISSQLSDNYINLIFTNIRTV